MCPQVYELGKCKTKTHEIAKPLKVCGLNEVRDSRFPFYICKKARND